MFVKVSERIKNWKSYKTAYLTEWYRDEKWRVKHRHLCSLDWLPNEKILWLKTLLKEDSSKVSLTDLKDLTLIWSKEFWSTAVFWILYNTFIKPKINRKYQNIIEAMVVNRIFEPKSKNGLMNWIKRVDNIIQSYPKNLPYEALDYLEKQQRTIERNMFKRDSKCTLYLYDITSTYFEWEMVEMAKYWYSRDHRSDRLQVNIWLVTDEEWCPITVEIIEWNIVDKSTIKDRIDDLRARFWLEEITFVFDRWMKSKVNLEYIVDAGFGYITALSHAQLKKIAEQNTNIQQSLFDKENLAEFDINWKKYVLSYNPSKAWKDTFDREKLIEKTIGKLKKITELKKPITQSKMQDKVSKTINHYNCEKYITYTVEEVEENWVKRAILKYERAKEKIAFDQKHDWFYMVESTVMNKSWEEIEQTYKNLQYVERAFDCVKNLIEIRPVFHYKDSRVKGHIVICFFSYYLLFQFKKLCREQLKIHTLDKLLTELRSISKSYFEIQKISISKVVKCSELQNEILRCCWVTI